MVSITSTSSLTNVMRQSILDMQTQLTKTQTEVSSGRVADLGLSLGGTTARDFALGIRDNDLAAISQSNGAVATRLDTTDSTLSSIADTAQNFLQTLVNAQSGVGSDPATIRSSAISALKSLISGLDTSVGGVHIFGGVNSGTAPIADYFSDPPSTAKQAVDQAFSAEFGMSQSNSDASSITADQMQTFLSGGFSNLFSSAGWSSDWSSASSRATQSRISLSQSIDTSVSANDPALQKLAMAYTMVADLGVTGLSDSAYQQVLKTATETMSQAVPGLTSLRASVGIMQQNVTDANQTISLQRTAISSQIGSLENVDPYEASTRLSSLMTQIETAYTITGKIQQLTLSKYI